MKKILIIGQGGREHALAWKISQSPSVEKIFVAPGNPGCAMVNKSTNINLTEMDEILGFALTEKIDLTIVGSEELLVQGIVDIFEKNNLVIFGPNKAAAKLEGSKAYSKQFMTKYNIKTAKYQAFDDYASAIKYLGDIEYPIVIKASGLAAGKGVIIAEDIDEADRALSAMLLENIFGNSGAEVIIEEYIVGVEASILAFTDGKTILPLISAKDHKKIGDGETGPNTGGMGVIVPNPYLTPEIEESFIKDILNPTQAGIIAEGLEFAGVVFFGLMIAENGVYLLEYNMRMGDPETQAILPVLKNDFIDVIDHCLNQEVYKLKLEWEDKSTCCVVLASQGYPNKSSKGKLISGWENFNQPDCLIFFAGVENADEGLVTAGGRVINVVAKANTLELAHEIAYKSLTKVSFDGCNYRTDIGLIDD